MVRVLLADDNARFRGTLRRLLERDPDIVVVAEAGDGNEALELAHEVGPDVVLMDVSMPGLDGLEATFELKARLPRRDRADALGRRQGAGDRGRARRRSVGVLLKGGPADEIVDAIKRYGPAGSGSTPSTAEGPSRVPPICGPVAR